MVNKTFAEAQLAPIRSRLTTVMQQVFGDPALQVTDSTTAEDIPGWDSIAHVTLIFSVEKEFKLRLSAGAVGKLDNVGDFVRLIAEKNGAASLN